MRGEVVKSLDILNQEHLALANYLGLSTPEAMVQIEKATGLGLKDFLNIGLLNVSPDNLSAIGVGHLQIDLVYRILKSDALSVKDVADCYYGHHVPAHVVDKIIAADVVTDRDLALSRGWGVHQSESREEAIRHLFTQEGETQTPTE